MYSLKEAEVKLAELSVLQGRNVDELVEQVREFKKIQVQVKESLEAKVIQNLISVVLKSDQDADFIIDPEEIAGLKLRLNTIDGVDFSEENFNKALQRSGYDPNNVDVQAGGFNIKIVLDVMKNLLDDDVPEEDNIFTINPDQVIAAQS